MSTARQPTKRHQQQLVYLFHLDLLCHAVRHELLCDTITTITPGMNETAARRPSLDDSIPLKVYAALSRKLQSYKSNGSVRCSSVFVSASWKPHLNNNNNNKKKKITRWKLNCARN